MAETALGAKPSGFGRFEPIQQLGSGGMAQVFLAAAYGPNEFRKVVVVKRLKPELADQTAMVEMFLNEARLAARLTHPNIVQTYEVYESDGAFFIVMEHIEGQPMNLLMRSPDFRREMTVEMWCRLAIQALTGLQYAHQLRDYDGQPLHIVHRDISPANLVVTYSGQLKVVDFGIAKATLNSSETEVGVLKGKVSYMAPEQIQGAADCRSDVFSMGATLWEALAGKKLFRGDTIQVINQVMTDSTPTLGSVAAGVPEELQAIVDCALARDPALRYPTAEAFRQALENYLSSVSAPPRDEDIGNLVARHFADARSRVQEHIDAFMRTSRGETPARTSGSPMALPPMTLPSVPRMAYSDSPPSASDIIARAGRPTGAKRSWPARTTLAAAGALLSVVLAGVAAMVVSGSKDQPATNALAPPAAPSPGVQDPLPQSTPLPSETAREAASVAVVPEPVVSATVAKPTAPPVGLRRWARTPPPRTPVPQAAASGTSTTSPTTTPTSSRPTNIKVLDEEDTKFGVTVIPE